MVPGQTGSLEGCRIGVSVLVKSRTPRDLNCCTLSNFKERTLGLRQLREEFTNYSTVGCNHFSLGLAGSYRPRSARSELLSMLASASGWPLRL
jgi:hypothetical protein